LPELASENINTDVEPSLSLTTEYYNYYRRYQAQVSNLESELAIPNYYLLDSSSYLIPSYNDKAVQSEYSYTNMKEFLTDTYINDPKNINLSLKNIFILDNSINENNGTRYDTTNLNGHFDGDLTYQYSLMPFGNKLQIESDLMQRQTDFLPTTFNDKAFRDIIENNEYKIKFLKLLKETFQDEISLKPSIVNFAINTSTIASTGILTGALQQTITTPIKLVDLPTMLLYSHRNPLSETNDITVLNSSSYSNSYNLSFDQVGTYRYQNTSASFNVLSKFLEEIHKAPDMLSYTYLDDRMGLRLGLYNNGNLTKHYETVAFRIQKIGGPPTGDYNTENTVQNIWFYNTENAITYLDTQVKYDSDYTYKIYKYDIVRGYKYQLSELRVSRQIASRTDGDEIVYCLEFYDPFTGATKNILVTDDETEMDLLEAELAPLIIERDALNESIRRAGEIVTDAGNLGDLLIDSGGSVFRSERSIFRGWPGYPFSFKESIISYSTSRAGPPPSTATSFRPGSGGSFVSIPEPDVILTDILYGRRDYDSSKRPSDYPTTVFDYIYEVFIDTSDPIGGSELEFGPPGTPPANRIRIRIQDFILTYLRPAQEYIDSVMPRVRDLQEQIRMRIVDHPPNSLIVTPHHLLDQSDRLAFYCKYNTFSQDSVVYPPALSTKDSENKSAYLIGHDFAEISKQSQESASRARFIEIYRLTEKPTSYEDFGGNLHKTIDLRQTNGDIVADHLFVERVRKNIKYYYAFRALNENRIAGQMSPIIEAELIDDGGYIYGKFEQFSEEEVSPKKPKEPITSFKKLLNIVPNIQHLQLDTSRANFNSSSLDELSNVSLGANTEDTLWDEDKYYKIRMTSKKTGKKIDLNITFKKE
jgi:hypothetical protein